VLLNHTSCPSLDGKVPLTVLTGVTQDISKLLRFHWYEHVLFREDESTFPSESPESSGRFVGFSENVGHDMTFTILTDKTNKIIYRSEVRTAEDPTSANLRPENWGDKNEIIESRHGNHEYQDKTTPLQYICDLDGETSKGMVIIDVDDLVGKSFPLEDNEGNTDTATIVEAICNHENGIQQHSSHTQFRVKHGKDKYEEIMSYNDIMDHFERHGEDPLQWEM